VEHKEDDDTNEDKDWFPWDEEKDSYTLGDLVWQAVLTAIGWAVLLFVIANVGRLVNRLNEETNVFEWWFPGTDEASIRVGVWVGGWALAYFGGAALWNSQRLWKAEGWSPRVLGNIVLGVMTVVPGVGIVLWGILRGFGLL